MTLLPGGLNNQGWPGLVFLISLPLSLQRELGAGGGHICRSVCSQATALCLQWKLVGPCVLHIGSRHCVRLSSYQSSDMHSSWTQTSFYFKSIKYGGLSICIYSFFLQPIVWDGDNGVNRHRCTRPQGVGEQVQDKLPRWRGSTVNRCHHGIFFSKRLNVNLPNKGT